MWKGTDTVGQLAAEINQSGAEIKKGLIVRDRICTNTDRGFTAGHFVRTNSKEH